MSTVDDHHEWLSFEDPEEDRTWLFDLTFLLSRWACIYGDGCPGIDSRADIGCCTHGAHFTDDHDRAAVEAAVATLTPEQWQFADVGRRKGILAKVGSDGWKTRIHQGGCIMLNRAGFSSGAGCALHQAAVASGQRPMDLKPEVCWQVPLRRVDSVDEVGHVTSTVREWKRRDWDAGGADFDWWCIEESAAFVGPDSVVVTMGDELAAMIGQGIYDLLLDAVAERDAAPTTVVPHPALRSGGARR